MDKSDQRKLQRLYLKSLLESGFFDDLLNHIEEDEYNREVLPHYGLIPDWYIYWRDLKDKVKALLR